MTFTIKQSDTSPALQAYLQDKNGNAISLSGATVRLHVKSIDGVTLINSGMTVVDAGLGLVRYNWQSADTANYGTYYAEFQVTYTDLTVETFPNTGNIAIVITPELI